MITHFAFVDCAESLIVAFVALVLFFAVGLKENKLGLRIVIWHRAIELFYAHFVKTSLLVNEGAAFLVLEQLDHQRQLLKV